MKRKLSAYLSDVEIDDGSGIISGYVSVFNGLDCYGDVIEPTAYDAVLASGVLPKIFFNHNSFDFPIGKCLELSKDEKGLKAKIQLNLDLPGGRDTYSSVKFGSVDGFSVSISFSEDDFTIDEQGNWHIHNVLTLDEISVVTYPADKSARISEIKSADVSTLRDLERRLREVDGLSNSDVKGITALYKSVLAKEKQEADQAKSVDQILNKINSIIGE